MKFLRFLKKNLFIILLAAVIAAGDVYLTNNNFIAHSDYFVKNDFEITQQNHPEKVWDKVFFGNSVVISSFMEDKSKSGYINLGLDYGVVTDLWEMIQKGHINIGSELVIGLNYLTLYDEFETNPTYIWHKAWYEPYAYFERDRFYPIIADGFDKLLKGESPLPYKYQTQEKAVYHGMVTEKAMNEKLAEYREEFFNLPINKFEKNLDALEKVISYCGDKGIRVRVVWMPWNVKYRMPQLLKDVRAEAEKIISAHNVELLDMETELPAEYFYDTGHLNYDVGSPVFTEMMDEWL